ncbi:hypothetical protein MKW92_032388 [Papaver armeniacum]|nr:hypothetical protein MKW92_032388 [Papaver armeniacum]
METGFEFIRDEKNKLHSDIESLNKKKAELRTDFELTNKEKDKLQNDIELLNEEKDKLQSDIENLIEFLNEEKAEFVRSVTLDVNESFYEREKTLAENENMFLELKEMNQTLAAKERFYTEELQEARQELIKQMESEKATKNKVIGLKRMGGDQVLWNFKENKRATLKEVISFRLSSTNT